MTILDKKEVVLLGNTYLSYIKIVPSKIGRGGEPLKKVKKAFIKRIDTAYL